LDLRTPINFVSHQLSLDCALEKSFEVSRRC